MQKAAYIRPSLTKNFYCDISFIEGLINLTRVSVDDGIFAGQELTYKNPKKLRDLDEWLQIDADAEIGDVQILKWEARKDMFDAHSVERQKKAIKLLIRISSDSEVLTKIDGKFFLTVPRGAYQWEGKYELTEVAGTNALAQDPVQTVGIKTSKAKKLLPNPWLVFECDNFISANWMLTKEEYGNHINPIDIPILKDLADCHQKKEVKEGVLSSDNFAVGSLQSELLKHVTVLQDSQDPKDYHPHSKQVVQDLVHPALFCFVAGESYVPEFLQPVMESLPARNANNVFHNTTSDLFGRNYEDSKYQWLPTDVTVEMDGRARFLSPLNNLHSDHVQLHECLEQLLTLAVPFFEEALGFVNRIGPLMHPDLEQGDNFVTSVDSERSLFVPLKGKQIQVIPKIVTYHLNPGQEYEGVWHVEGMSHENIVATGLYILYRSQSLAGGELMFKRQYTSEEGGHFMRSVPQTRNCYANEMIHQGWQPLGKLKTPEGRFIVFPNSHAHKLTKLENLGKEPASRTIIVFFLVHPDVKLISTAHVPSQNWTMNQRGVKALMEKQMEIWGLAIDECESALQEILGFVKWGFTIDEAKKHRLKLMEERKYNKQTWNIREVELCEH